MIVFEIQRFFYFYSEAQSIKLVKKLCLVLLLTMVYCTPSIAQSGDHYTTIVNNFDKLLREQPELLFQDLNLRIHVAKRNGRKEEIARYKYLLGKAYNKLEEKEEAQSVLKSALTSAKTDSTSGHIHYELGNLYYQTGKYEDGIKHHNKSIARFKKLNRNTEQAASINSIGLIYDELTQYDEALVHYRKALDIYLMQNNELKASSVLTNIGLFLFHERQSAHRSPIFQKKLCIKIEFG